MQAKNKILLTGGHAATTGMAVVEELVRRKSKENLEISWIGARSAVEGKKIPNIEFRVFPNLNIKTYSIISGRWQRKFTFWTIPSFFKIPIGFFQSLFLISKIKPRLTLSFGGYAALPVVFASWIFRIPVILHEQTAAAGLANRISAFFAEKILLARESSGKFFDPQKSQVTGNPVMTQIAEIPPKNVIGDPPVILITSGSRGSQIINKVVSAVLDNLLQKYRVIHISGEIDYPEFSGKKNTAYEVFPWVDPMKMDGLYREADLVIARAGANTVAEIMITRRPSILIPIPWSYLNEQFKNAEFAVNFGIAKIINQQDLSGKVLLEEIAVLIKNWEAMISKVKDKESLDKNASKKVVDTIENYLK